MRLFLVGGSGRTGRLFLPLALQAGHAVTALARRPASVTLAHERLRVLQGDVGRPETLAGQLSGHHAVLAILSPPSMSGLVDTFTVGATTLCRAMQSEGVRRLLFVTSGAVEDDPELAWLFRFVIKPLLMRKVYADAARAEEIVRSSALDWTLVRPARLTDGPPTGTYRVSPRGLPPGGSVLSRADLAHFLLAEVDHPQHLHGTPTLAA
jgi:putative NADH-flavin reductase